MNKRILITILAVVILAGSFAVYSLSFKNRLQNEAKPLKKVTLGVEMSLLPISVWVAKNNEYFNENGLDLTIKGFDSGKLSFLAMLNGEVDISTVAPTPIVFSSFTRQDFCIFSSFVYSYDDIKVIVSKSKGINSAQDLKGKRIGTPFGTTGQFFTEAFLTHNRVLSSELDIIDVAPSDLPEALKNNEVDAIVIWEPHAYNATQLSPNETLRLPSSNIYKETFNFMAMKDFVKINKEILKNFIKAVDKATMFAKNNREESINIIESMVNLDKEVISSLWDDFVLELTLEHSLILTLEDEARWAIESGLTSTVIVPNYLDYIYLDALEEVKPIAVTIIR